MTTAPAAPSNSGTVQINALAIRRSDATSQACRKRERLIRLGRTDMNVSVHLDLLVRPAAEMLCSCERPVRCPEGYAPQYMNNKGFYGSLRKRTIRQRQRFRALLNGWLARTSVFGRGRAGVTATRTDPASAEARLSMLDDGGPLRAGD